MKLFLSSFLLFVSSYSMANSLQKFPEFNCNNQELRIRVVDISYCVQKNDISHVSFLGLSNQTAVIKLKNKELSIGLNPAKISIGDLHRKLNLTVSDFFLALFDNKLENIVAIRQSFDIDEDNPLQVFTDGSVYAFVIMGSNKDYDRIYYNKKESDVIYQVTGEFDNAELQEILSSIKYH